MNLHEFLHNIKSRYIDVYSSQLSRYRIEIILISLAGFIAGASLLTAPPRANSIRTQETPLEDMAVQKVLKQKPTQSPLLLAVDVSGAVNSPDVYYASPGARIVDMIKMAGGLSYQADVLFVERNFNMSTYIFDQEKIHIPSIWDISQGIFVEEPKLLEYLEPRAVETKKNSSISPVQSTSALSLNTASVEELDMLPGVGPVTAQKIIDNRPYESADELVSKKVINASLWDKIQEMVAP